MNIFVTDSNLDPALRELAVEYRPVGTLKPWSRNPRTHSRKQILQIADSIRIFGWTNPVLIDDNGCVIAGHGRLEAAKLLQIETAPTIRLDHMSDAQKRAYVLADNKLAENAGWDQKLLGLELQYLSELDLDFDVTITGFETAEIDVLLQGTSNAPDDPADDVPEVDTTRPAISLPGDLWLIGRHRLFCGDATCPESFSRLMEGETAQMVFIDPPYNVPIDGHVCGLGSVKHREFAMASGEMSEEQFTAFLKSVFDLLMAHSTDGSIHFVCMDWRHMGEVLGAARGVYGELKNLCVWNKTNAGMGSLYRSKHELVFVFKSGSAPHINNVELGRHGRYRTNVWDYAGANALHAGRQDELAMHPTVKPVALVADAIQDCSRRKGIVLDCFAGSGTTLLAAQRTGRRGYAMELDPRYVDLILCRLADHEGLRAVHAGTDKTFDEIRDERTGKATSDG